MFQKMDKVPYEKMDFQLDQKLEEAITEAETDNRRKVSIIFRGQTALVVLSSNLFIRNSNEI